MIPWLNENQSMRSTIFAALSAAAVGTVVAGPILADEASKPPKVDFAREVLPILSDKCFVCHGPAGEKKKVLRLDSYAGATRDLGGYRAINPKALERSEILAR